MFRLCVVGSGGVGKSSLTIRYLKNEFTEVNMPVEPLCALTSLSSIILQEPLLSWCFGVWFYFTQSRGGFLAEGTIEQRNTGRIGVVADLREYPGFIHFV